MKKRIIIFVLLTTAFFLLPIISRARDYNADIGRFMTMDTFEGDQEKPQSLHKYVYGADDPVNNIDPSGHDFESLDVGDALASFDGFNFNFSIAQITSPLSLSKPVEVYSYPFTDYAHTFLKITPDNPALFPGVPMEIDPDGKKFFTIGGHPGGGANRYLLAKLTDLDPGSDVAAIKTKAAFDRGSVTKGGKNNGLISEIINMRSNYEQHRVWYVGQVYAGYKGGYNCNSLTAGFIEAAGALGPDLAGNERFNGYDNPVPAPAFGR